MNMDVTDLVTSQWLTADDVRTSQSKIAIILDGGKISNEISLKGEAYKALILPIELDRVSKFWKLNKHSLKKLTQSFGNNDTSTWVGKQIKLTTMLMQGGKEGIVPQ